MQNHRRNPQNRQNDDALLCGTVLLGALWHLIMTEVSGAPVSRKRLRVPMNLSGYVDAAMHMGLFLCAD